jgi:branched-subunit amino acid transport protein
MSSGWLAVVVVGLATATIKATGPVFLGGRELPPRLVGVVTLLAPALLTALVATLTFGSGASLSIDARAVGLLAGGIAVVARAPTLLVVILAALATAGARIVGLG